jgi:hypothetical protein
MRAREFTINVPINIRIDGNGDPQVDMPTGSDSVQNPDGSDKQPVMMTPQEQELELKKAELGKNSKYIDQLLDEPDDGWDAEDEELPLNIMTSDLEDPDNKSPIS